MAPRIRQHNFDCTPMEKNLAIGRIIFRVIIFAIALCGVIGMVIFSLAHRSGLS